MFDIGFWELFLVMLVALLVVGPERLPGLMRTLGLWVGRARRTLQNVQDEVRRELAAEDLKRTLEAQKQSIGVHEIVEETRESLEAVTRRLDEELRVASAGPGRAEAPEEPASSPAPAPGAIEGAGAAPAQESPPAASPSQSASSSHD